MFRVILARLHIPRQDRANLRRAIERAVRAGGDHPIPHARGSRDIKSRECVTIERWFNGEVGWRGLMIPAIHELNAAFRPHELHHFASQRAGLDGSSCQVSHGAELHVGRVVA